MNGCGRWTTEGKDDRIVENYFLMYGLREKYYKCVGQHVSEMTYTVSSGTLNPSIPYTVGQQGG